MHYQTRNDTKEYQPELKITNKETQQAMNIVCRYVECRPGIACQKFKAMLHFGNCN